MMDLYSFFFLLAIFLGTEQSWAQESLLEGGADAFFRLVPLSLLAYLFYQRRSERAEAFKGYAIKSLVPEKDLQKLNSLLHEIHLDSHLKYLKDPDGSYQGILIKNEDRASHFEIVVQEKLAGKDLFTFEPLVLELKNKIDLDHCTFLPTLVLHRYTSLYKGMRSALEFAVLSLILLLFLVPYLLIMLAVQLRLLNIQKNVINIRGQWDRNIDLIQYSNLKGQTGGIYSLINFFEQIQLIISGDFALIGPQWQVRDLSSKKSPMKEKLFLITRPGVFHWNEVEHQDKIHRLLFPSIKRDISDLCSQNWRKFSAKLNA